MVDPPVATQFEISALCPLLPCANTFEPPVAIQPDTRAFSETIFEVPSATFARVDITRSVYASPAGESDCFSPGSHKKKKNNTAVYVSFERPLQPSLHAHRKNSIASEGSSVPAANTEATTMAATLAPFSIPSLVTVATSARFVTPSTHSIPRSTAAEPSETMRSELAFDAPASCSPMQSQKKSRACIFRRLSCVRLMLSSHSRHSASKTL